MQKAKIYLFTSPTCPHCPAAKQFMDKFKKERDDFVYHELSTAIRQNQVKAHKFNVTSVPTFIIQGPGYPSPIGLRGTQNTDTMNKYIDLALGNRSLDENQKSRKSRGIKIGKFRIKF